MQTNMKITILCLSMITFLSTGCITLQEEPDPAQDTISTEQANTAVQKRFQDSAAKSPSAVDSAIELAKKHAKLSEEMAALQQEYANLTAENEQMKKHIDVLEPDLKQTKKKNWIRPINS